MIKTFEEKKGLEQKKIVLEKEKKRTRTKYKRYRNKEKYY